MTILSTTCPRCRAAVEVPVESLLLAVTEGADPCGRLAYICPACDDLTDLAVSLRTVTMLCAGGCEPLEAALTEEQR